MLLRRHVVRRAIVVGIVLSVFILYINETDFDLIVYDIPESVSSFFSTLSEGRDQNTPSAACRCKFRSWPGANYIPSQLKLSLSWIRNTTTRDYILRHHPNFPLSLLNGNGNGRCSLLPTIFSIDWVNRLWQRATFNSNESFYLYSAFYDPKPAIRLLGVSQSKSPSYGWCQVWFNSYTPPLVVKVSRIVFLDYRKRDTEAQVSYLLTCPLPSVHASIPVAVSLSSDPCKQATNLLRVTGAKEREVSAYRSKQIPDNPSKLVNGWAAAVCGPALYYYHEDFSSRLVEWLELLRSQGFSQVFLHVTDVHPNITKVLHHYTQEGFVQVTDYTYPPPYINEPSMRKLWAMVESIKMYTQENIYFSDCVLRHMHQYRFLLHIDPDEMVFLLKHDNFTHFLDDLMMQRVKKTPRHGFKFEWRMFYSNISPSNESASLPDNLWILRHTARTSLRKPKLPPGGYKPIYDMNVVRGVFSHGSVECVSGGCSHMTMKVVPSETGVMGHFKSTCNEKCQKTIKHDLTLLKYKEQVRDRVQKVLKALNLL